MWSNGEDFNEEGDRVRLYQPIAYSSGRNFSTDDPTTSYIGGPVVTALTPAAFCSHCQEPLERLVQLHIPQNQSTYQVLACNKAKCVNALFAQHKFHLGGDGVVQCFRVEASETMAASEQPPPETQTSLNPGEKSTSKKPETNKSNDWLMDSDDDEDDEDNLQDLEQQVAAMEMKKEPKSEDNHTTKSNKKTKKKAASKSSQSKNDTGLPCFELHTLLEPPGNYHKPAGNHDDDDDDDDDSIVGGMGTSSKDDAKIQQMLAKYMAEEDDDDILTALQGVTNGTGGGGSNNKSREKDERLKAADRALYAFTDRIKRSPRQVLRYASGGLPLWSIPRAPQSLSNKPHKKSKISFQEQKQKQKNNNNEPQPLVIPKCACGAERRFEFQLMPSLLHVLEVDKYAAKASSGVDDGDGDALDTIMNQDYGGMNWGAIAVYVCPKSGITGNCSKDEFVIVQASVDETPHKRAVAPSNAAVIIGEDQTFDALCNDGDLEGGDYYDEETDDEASHVDEKDLVFTLDG